MANTKINPGEMLELIENLTGKKIDIEIKETELISFLHEPELFLNDKDLIKDIQDLKILIAQMSDIYHD